MFQLMCWTAVSLAGAEARPVTTKIEEVTVFPSSALVRRATDLPAGGGAFVVAGLPWGLDPDSVRVRCVGADVVGIEARERRVEAAPGERAEELRGRMRALQGEIAALKDELGVGKQVGGYLARLLELEERSHAELLLAGKVAPEVWRANLDFLAAQIGANRRAQRETGWRIEESEARRRDLELEMGRVSTAGGVALRDVYVELPAGAAAAKLELEYVVAGAGWLPLYDLRTARDARSVEMSYRAQVWQQTGEDWNDVSLALSTARPQLGAQGPDPEAIWLSLYERSSHEINAPAAAAPQEELEALKGLGYLEDKDAGPFDAKAFEASVERQGLSVRFRIAQRESVQSRPEPANVLIGRAKLDVTPEYFAAPLLDTNVWLRGKTTNSSEWAMLPGRAAVYFGADFLGHAQLGAVQPGEELVLHLGPDPALSLERTLLEDLAEGPGIFGGDASRTQRVRIRFKNAGAAAHAADGSALVYVREALPRSTDERITVKLLDPRPALSTDERWKKEREEQSLLVWALKVPRDGEALVTYGTKVSFPKGVQVVQ